MIVKDLIDKFFTDKKKNIELLKKVCIEELEKDDVKPGYPDWNGINVQKLPAKPGVMPNVTWCNRYAARVMERLGYDMPLLYNKTTGRTVLDWSSPLVMYSEAVKLSQKPSSGVIEVPIREAVRYANNGIGIIIIAEQGVGHVGIVWPSGNDNCMVANAGSEAVFGYNKSILDTFYKWGCRPRFFKLRKVK